MIIQANALSLPIAAGVVQCCVTSPPYWGLRNYGVHGQLGLERTPDEYVASMVAVFREVWRVLRDDGTLWLNLGDSYNANGRDGHGTRVGYKQGTNRASASGTDSNRPTDEALKPKDLVGIPWRVAFALQADGWYLRSDIIWSKLNPMPESVTDRPTKAHEYVFLLAKSERYYWNRAAVAEPHKADSIARRGRTRTGGKFLDGDGGQPHGNPHSITTGLDDCLHPDGRNIRTVWTVATQPYAGAHFATMPEKLVEPCIKAGTKPGDLVLDPFAGSGTVGLVAAKLNRRFVGTELNADYIGMARRRMSGVQVSLLEA